MNFYGSEYSIVNQLQ